VRNTFDLWLFWLLPYCISGLGKISRNCTEFGWSEPFPHYVDACIGDNSTNPVSISSEWNLNDRNDSDHDGHQ